MKWDAVLSAHTNPATCGTAKWSKCLAEKLGIPFDELYRWHHYRYPLVSVRLSETQPLSRFWPADAWRHLQFDLFVHDLAVWDGHALEYTDGAGTIFAANRALATELRDRRLLTRGNLVEAWCPSALHGTAHRGAINVLTFGMAHKIQPRYYEKLKALLDVTGEDYTVSVSTAIHEGSPWDETALVADKLRAIFGDRLRVLGYLADDALVAEMARCTAIAIFYDPAVRENNTSFWAALQAGKPVLTNKDAESPAIGGWYDIERLTHWPTFDHGVNAEHFQQQYGWDRLLVRLREPVCVP